MEVTIYTDAAYHTRAKVGGYGFWIDSPSKKITCSGLIPKTHSSLHAEMSAIFFALKYITKDPDITEVRRLIIYTDCLDAINHITKKHKGLASDTAKALRMFKKKVGLATLPNANIFRHVKAHTDICNKESFINEWCDKKAKMWLWRKVNKDPMPSFYELDIVMKKQPRHIVLPDPVLLPAAAPAGVIVAPSFESLTIK